MYREVYQYIVKAWLGPSARDDRVAIAMLLLLGTPIQRLLLYNNFGASCGIWWSRVVALGQPYKQNISFWVGLLGNTVISKKILRTRKIHLGVA